MRALHILIEFFLCMDIACKQVDMQVIKASTTYSESESQQHGSLVYFIDRARLSDK